MILGHERAELFAAQCRRRIAVERALEKPIGQRVFFRRPAGQEIKFSLGANDAAGGFAKLVSRGVPAGDEAEHVGGGEVGAGLRAAGAAALVGCGGAATRAVGVAGTGLPKETVAVVLRAVAEPTVAAVEGVPCAVDGPPPQAAPTRTRTVTTARGAPRIAPLYGFHSGQGGARRRPAILTLGMNMLSFCCTYNW